MLPTGGSRKFPLPCKALFGFSQLFFKHPCDHVADGPKVEGGQLEFQLCEEARRVAEVGVNWPCEVKRVYAPKNMGLRVRLESGLDEVFLNETKAILLEEDCHPMPDFFPFCQEMLARYRENPKIAGNCFLPIQAPISSRYFSLGFCIFGDGRLGEGFGETTIVLNGSGRQSLLG